MSIKRFAVGAVGGLMRSAIFGVAVVLGREQLWEDALMLAPVFA